MVLGMSAVGALFFRLEGWATRWPQLLRVYPAGDEQVIRTQLGVTGELGWGMLAQNALALAACERGLRVSRWFRQPILVPWGDIMVEQTGGLVVPMTQLVFGEPEVGRLRIPSRVWERLVVAQPEGAQ